MLARALSHERLNLAIALCPVMTVYPVVRGETQTTSAAKCSSNAGQVSRTPADKSSSLIGSLEATAGVLDAEQNNHKHGDSETERGRAAS